MQTITFTCEIITPMFLAGADGLTPELRPPSIKGALRFWWRAMHGNLEIEELKKQETVIFGGGGDLGGKSLLIVRTNQLKYDGIYKAPLLPHKINKKEQSWIPAFQPSDLMKRSVSDDIIVTLSLSRKNNGIDLKKINSLFVVLATLAGLGRRTRRGFGSIKITKINGQPFCMPSTMDEIWPHIKLFNHDYTCEKGDFGKIFLNSSSWPERRYPYIEKIEIGAKKYCSYNDLLYSIGDATHKFKNNDHSLGYTYKKERLASPIYVSVIRLTGDDYRPIITTLHMADNEKGCVCDWAKQEEFKRSLL